MANLGEGDRSAPGSTYISGGIFGGVITCYMYPSLRIATSNLYLLVNYIYLFFLSNRYLQPLPQLTRRKNREKTHSYRTYAVYLQRKFSKNV